MLMLKILFKDYLVIMLGIMYDFDTFGHILFIEICIIAF